MGCSVLFEIQNLLKGVYLKDFSVFLVVSNLLGDVHTLMQQSAIS